MSDKATELLIMFLYLIEWIEENFLHTPLGQLFVFIGLLVVIFMAKRD